VGRTGLIGREPEHVLLGSFLDQVAAGGSALVLSGEPGVGKSVLLDAAALAAEGRGFRVLRASGVEFEADVGYSGLNQLLLWPPGEEFGRLAPEHQDALQAALGLRSQAPANRLVVATAVLTLLRRAAEARPVLAVVDDLQWLDRASAAVLSFAARRLDGSRVGLLVAARTDQDTFFDSGGLPEHELRPLDSTAASDLLGTCFPDLADGVRHRVLAEAQGNPLALLELPPALSGPQLAAHEALPDVLPLSRRLQALFADRIAALPPPARDLLLLAALDGTGDLGVLQVAGDLADLAAAERAGLVNADGARLAFRHPLVRSSMVNFATGGERRRAHRMLADALTDRPDRRAWHLAHATPGADEQVATLLEEASQRALRRGDAIGGVAALLRAADLSPRGADRSRRLVEAAYVGAEVTGELHSVPRLLADAGRADPDPCGSLPAAVATAYQLLNGEGDVATAHRLLTSAIAARAGRYDASDRGLIEALFALLVVCSFSGRPPMGEPFDATMARLRPDVPPLLAVAAALFADPARAPAAALGDLDALIGRLHQETDPVRIVWIGRSALFADKVSGCREALLRVIRDGHSGGAVASAIAATIPLCFHELRTGDWDEAEKLAGEALDLCEAHGYRLLEWSLWYAQAMVAAARGEGDTARELSERMIRWAAPRGAEAVRLDACAVRALAALGNGDAEEAYRNAAAVSPPGVLARYVPQALWTAPDLVEAAVLTGRHEEAAAHVRAMRDSGIAALSARLALTVAFCSAVAAAPDRADAQFEAALAIPGIERWPFDVARVRLAYGERLRRSHATALARTHLTAAADIFERLGARPWAARVRSELRAAGIGCGPAPLTPQEREIALLAATGLTNKQVGQRLHLSHRTIGAHLYRIFPKLGITSRAALRDALDATLEPGASG
jgi:DNA-binding CsgD family transcriptional regulator